MDVRRHILELLADPSISRLAAPGSFPRSVQKAAGCRSHEVFEALWGLVAEGLIYPDGTGDQGRGTDWWVWKPSALGMQAIESGSWEPRDQAGFMRRLKRADARVDAVSIRYAEEALRAFNARCYLSTVVMIGVASESAFLLLASAVAVAVGPEQARALIRSLENPKASQHQRFSELRKLLEHRRSTLPSELVDQLTLDAVADLLRVARNEAGHPTGTAVDEDTARTSLLIAGPYLVKMAALAAHVSELGPGSLTI